MYCVLFRRKRTCIILHWDALGQNNCFCYYLRGEHWNTGNVVKFGDFICTSILWGTSLLYNWLVVCFDSTCSDVMWTVLVFSILLYYTVCIYIYILPLHDLPFPAFRLFYLFLLVSCFAVLGLDVCNTLTRFKKDVKKRSTKEPKAKSMEFKRN